MHVQAQNKNYRMDLPVLNLNKLFRFHFFLHDISVFLKQLLTISKPTIISECVKSPASSTKTSELSGRSAHGLRKKERTMHKMLYPKKQGIAKIALIGIILILASFLASAVPSGPTVTVLFNETKQPAAAKIINTSGGTITTIVLNATTQNTRWKAYVGNVTGRLVLDDGNDNTLFDWSLTNVVGEVYTTRFEGSINWSGINCSNQTHIANENVALNHTNKDDNITTTFNTQVHSGFYTGTRQILSNTCFSVHTYVNSTSQQSMFEEVVLYDGTNATNGNIVYASILERDAYGFDNQTYDFQMIVPEVGLSGFSGSTGYYFYAELI